MKKTLTVVAIFLMALGLQAKEVVKVGVILPLTGSMDILGVPIRELMVYKINNLPASSRFEYKFIFEDDQLMPRQTLLAARRLVDFENIDILVSFFSGPGTVLAPYATQKRIPHIMDSFDERAADGIYNFTYITSVSDCARVWTDYVESLGYRRAALFITRNSGGDVSLKALEDFKNKSLIEWVSVERFNPDERDFRVALTKLRETKPDMLFLFAVDPAQPIIIRQMKELGWDIPVTSFGNFEVQSQNPLFEGKWFVGVNRPTEEFQDWYDGVFHKPFPYAGGVYSDIIDIIYNVCEKSGDKGKPSKDDIALSLRKIKDFHGACGSISVTDKGVIKTPANMVIIRNKKATPVSLEELKTLLKK